MGTRTGRRAYLSEALEEEAALFFFSRYSLGGFLK